MADLKEIEKAGVITICTGVGLGTAIGGELKWRGDQVEITKDNLNDAHYLIQNGQAELGAQTYNDPAPAKAEKNKAVDAGQLAQK